MLWVLSAGGCLIDPLQQDVSSLAECSSKADEYSDANPEFHRRHMLLCRATLGKFLYDNEVNPNLSSLLEKLQDKSRGYHSILGDRCKAAGTYREFIIFDQDQIYPNYIIEYSRFGFFQLVKHIASLSAPEFKLQPSFRRDAFNFQWRCIHRWLSRVPPKDIRQPACVEDAGKCIEVLVTSMRPIDPEEKDPGQRLLSVGNGEWIPVASFVLDIVKRLALCPAWRRKLGEHGVLEILVRQLANETYACNLRSWECIAEYFQYPTPVCDRLEEIPSCKPLLAGEMQEGVLTGESLQKIMLPVSGSEAQARRNWITKGCNILMKVPYPPPAQNGVWQFDSGTSSCGKVSAVKMANVDQFFYPQQLDPEKWHDEPPRNISLLCHVIFLFHPVDASGVERVNELMTYDIGDTFSFHHHNKNRPDRYIFQFEVAHRRAEFIGGADPIIQVCLNTGRFAESQVQSFRSIPGDQLTLLPRLPPSIQRAPLM